MKKIKNRREKSLLTGVASIAGLFILALRPLPALALDGGCQTGDNYMEDKTIQHSSLALIPSEINLNKDMSVNQMIYRVPLQSLTYTCYTGDTPDAKGKAPRMRRGGGSVAFINQLEKAGLRPELTINGQTWDLPNQEFFNIWPAFSQSENYRQTLTLSGELRLILTEHVAQPKRILIDKSDRIITIDNGLTRSNYITLDTKNNTLVSYIPHCIGKVRVPTDIDLGRVITGGSGSIPSPRQFNITTSFNQDCAGFGNVKGWNGFTLPLFIQFEAPGGKLTSGRNGILLENENKEENGLILEIKPGAGGGAPVKFSDWNGINPSLTLTNNPLTTYYTAGLKSVGPISSLKKGDFHQEITVKIRYE
ncbi:hypothetical protein LE36_07800 [Salmonella enterica subsp. diarizonae]|nr:hypothetical protein [Salmonella enterica subsp. diarizonae]